MEKNIPIFNLEITNDLEDDVEVDVISLVDRPAIERSFLAFTEDEFAESYTDYPESAKNNAQRALDWAEKNGWGDCGEATGKLRANQIAKGEPISRETIARISGFKRHQQNKDVPYSEGCGGLMWDAWGGTSMIEWASNKLQKIDKKKLSMQIDLGGEGSGCQGDNCGRPAGSGNDLINDIGSIIEKGDLPSAEQMDKLSENDYKAELLISEMVNWKNGIYNPNLTLNDDTRPIFNKLTSKKDYELYRIDPTIKSYSIGQKINYNNRPTYVSSDKEFVKNMGKLGDKNNPIIVFEKGNNTLNLNKKDGRGEELLIGEYEIKDIKDDMIFVKKTKLSFTNLERKTFVIQDMDQQIISGPLMLADTPIYRNDHNGEYYVVFTKETIKKIAQRYFKKGYQANVNLMHDSGQTVEGVTMFESFITDKVRGIQAMKGFEDVPDGSWFGSFKVDNPDVWAEIKAGNVRGFSVEGQFNYRKTGDKKIEQLWAKVLDVLSNIE